jgi:hypothetical protein
MDFIILDEILQPLGRFEDGALHGYRANDTGFERRGYTPGTGGGVSVRPPTVQADVFVGIRAIFGVTRLRLLFLRWPHLTPLSI